MEVKTKRMDASERRGMRDEIENETNRLEGGERREKVRPRYKKTKEKEKTEQIETFYEKNFPC